MSFIICQQFGIQSLNLILLGEQYELPSPVGFASFYRTITELSIRPFKCPVNTPKPRSERKSGENQKYYDRLTIDDKVVHELKNWHKQIHLHSIKI